MGGRFHRVGLVCLVLLHVAATCYFLPPRRVLDDRAVRIVDHPTHTHRIHLFRAALFQSGLPWGYDPAFGGGTVEGPDQGHGTKPQQVLGALCFFLSPPQVQKLFTFLVALTFPLWTIISCRMLHLTPAVQSWVLACLGLPMWMIWESPYCFSRYLHSGVVTYVLACTFAPLVLVLFLACLRQPSVGRYVGFCLAGSLLFLFHCLGPLPLIIPLAILGLFAGQLSLRWRTALLLSPLIIAVANAFWLVPYLLFEYGPAPPWQPLSHVAVPSDLTFASWTEARDWLTRFQRTDLAVFGGCLLAFVGLAAMRHWCDKRTVFAFALAIGLSVSAVLVGSFLPGLAAFQPQRFALAALCFACLPMGIALNSAACRLGLPSGGSALAFTALVVAFCWTQGEPRPLPFPPWPDPLASFVTGRTKEDARLLIQSRKPGDYETRVLPLVLNREVIGRTRVNARNLDPTQFQRDSLWGRPLCEWKPAELEEALQRWGIRWVFTCTDDAARLLRRASGREGEPAGDFLAFELPGTSSRFLIGDGRVRAAVNELRLSELQPKRGLVVLRYRYHPAWKAEGGLDVLQYPVPEDPVGFIALRDPPKSLVLRFDAWAMLAAEWPRCDRALVDRSAHP